MGPATPVSSSRIDQPHLEGSFIPFFEQNLFLFLQKTPQFSLRLMAWVGVACHALDTRGGALLRDYTKGGGKNDDRSL
jgi:hypothetical protein